LNQIRAVDPARYAADLPGPFADIVREALVRDPRDRRITMREIAEMLV
jgi:hypothetical protein